jgi:hypothetical protein
MSFVVKVTAPTGQIMWLSRPLVGAHRTFGPHDTAAKFLTRPNAKSAIDELPAALRNQHFNFAVEESE